jgi:hypothetical protein
MSCRYSKDKTPNKFRDATTQPKKEEVKNEEDLVIP